MNDLDIMPTGVHKGKAMGEIPIAYFHFLWNQKGYNSKRSEVANYIRAARGGMMMDKPHLTWKKDMEDKNNKTKN